MHSHSKLGQGSIREKSRTLKKECNYVIIIQDLQDRADTAEAAVVKGGQKAVLKAESKLKTLQVLFTHYYSAFL